MTDYSIHWLEESEAIGSLDLLKSQQDVPSDYRYITANERLALDYLGIKYIPRDDDIEGRVVYGWVDPDTFKVIHLARRSEGYAGLNLTEFISKLLGL